MKAQYLDRLADQVPIGRQGTVVFAKDIMTHADTLAWFPQPSQPGRALPRKKSSSFDSSGHIFLIIS
jgi:hypothetical protein